MHSSPACAANSKTCPLRLRFTGSAGEAIVSKTVAYLVTGPIYWAQAQRQIDKNWKLVRAGGGEPDAPVDWIDFLAERAKDAKIGIDARMLSHDKAVKLNALLGPKGSKLHYLPQNLVDLIWKEKPSRSREQIFVQSTRLAGKSASAKLNELREWIKNQPASVPSYSKREAKDAEKQTGTLITDLPSIGAFGSREGIAHSLI